MANLLMTKFFKSIEIILKIYYYSTIKNRKDIFMKNRLMKNLFKVAALLIFFIFMFIQACGPTPAEAITDASGTSIGNSLSSLVSVAPVLGGAYLYIGNISATSVAVGFSDYNGSNPITENVTNISGELGNYIYGNGNFSVSIRVADNGSANVTITRLRTPFFSLENVECITP